MCASMSVKAAAAALSAARTAESRCAVRSAQCFYREGHTYIVKNPMVCLFGPTTKF